jgi:hypothetical protein
MAKILFFCTIFFFAFSIKSFAQSMSGAMPAKEFKTKAEKDAWLNSQTQVPEFKTQAEKDAWVKKQQVEKIDPDKISKIEAAISNEAEKDAYLNKRQNIVYMTQAEFNSLPADKKTAVLADKNFVIIK